MNNYYKNATIEGPIVGYLPNGLVEVDYAGTPLVVQESENIYGQEQELKYPLNWIAKMKVDGNALLLPTERMTAKEYADVKKILLKSGGTYKKNSFVFEEPAGDVYLRIISGEDYNLKKKFQYFPTPPATADYMVKLADIKCGMSFLEPSAGRGSIINAIHRVCPYAFVDYYEIMETNRKYLEAIPTARERGIMFENAIVDEEVRHYDRIIANPPFSNNQDENHIYIMYELLNPGGKLVTVSSNHWQFAKEKSSANFRQWIEKVGAQVIDVPVGTFKESGTMIPTLIIVIDKPAKAQTNGIISAKGNKADIVLNGKWVTVELAEPLVRTQDGEKEQTKIKVILPDGKEKSVSVKKLFTTGSPDLLVDKREEEEYAGQTKAQTIEEALKFLDEKEKKELILAVRDEIAVLEQAAAILNNDETTWEDANILQTEINSLENILKQHSVCETGQVEKSRSRVVDGKYEFATTTVIKAFDSALQVKEYLDKIPPGEKSMYNQADTGGLAFKVPTWHRDSNGIKLFFEYKNGEECPYVFSNITSQTKTVNDQMVLVLPGNDFSGMISVFLAKDVRKFVYENHSWNHKASIDIEDRLHRLTNFNLSEATAAEMYELLSFGHPDQKGFNVSRSAMQREWEKRGEQMTEELGLPTDLDYPYINRYTGTIEPLHSIIEAHNKNRTESRIWWWTLHEHWLPIADIDGAIASVKLNMAENWALPTKKFDSHKDQNYYKYIEFLEQWKLQCTANDNCLQRGNADTRRERDDARLKVLDLLDRKAQKRRHT